MNQASSSKDLVLVSGYYGFGNLGDEAILEEIVAELSRLVPREKIVILSQDPEATERTFSVRAVNRWKLPELSALFGKAKLFVSGGGGLYQDVSSVKSVVYYAGLAFLARAARVPTMIYAQGVGPLSSSVGRTLSRAAFSQASEISVRDRASFEMLSKWGLKPHLTADPVWCLAPSELPETITNQLLELKPISDNGGEKKPLLIGLSLRKTHDIKIDDVKQMVSALIEATPESAVLVPLILFGEQDEEFLSCARQMWNASGRKAVSMETADLRPSQWLKLISHLDLMVAMRFHALLMALRSGVACVGLAYDPKVAYLMEKFEQPSCNMRDAASEQSRLPGLVSEALGNASQLGSRAKELSVESEALACQNFDLLARIINMQSAG